MTLALFPNVVSNIKRSNSYLISDKYFTPILCLLSFNTSALVGNLIPNYKKWPKPERLWIIVVGRSILIPFFLCCNFLPAVRKWPVFFSSDLLFALGTFTLGLTQGHGSSMSLMYVFQSSDKAHTSYAAMIGAFFLVLGLFAGVYFSFILTWIVQL